MKITFNGSPGPTLGVELELQIIDPETKNLVSGAGEIIERSRDEQHVKPELIQSTIELNTDICQNVADVRRELSERIARLLAVCDDLGYEVACAGTHPFAAWSQQQVTPKDRYQMLMDRCQWPARRLMIFGLHVHVGVENGEKAIAVFDSLSTYLPHLLALSASSPFFDSHDTGLASCRAKIFESLPTAGLPYRLLNWAEFQRLMITLVNSKTIETIREIWWDVRPHPDFGTVEIRMCDGFRHWTRSSRWRRSFSRLSSGLETGTTRAATCPCSGTGSCVRTNGARRVGRPTLRSLSMKKDTSSGCRIPSSASWSR